MRIYRIMPITMMLACMMGIFINSYLFSAQRVITPDGETVIRSSILTNNNTQYRLSATQNTLYLSSFTNKGAWDRNNELFMSPPSRVIADMCLQQGGQGSTRQLFLMLDIGTVYVFTIDLSKLALTNQPEIIPAPEVSSSGSFRKILGNKKIYILQGGKIYLNGRDGEGWALDTSGLSGYSVNDLALDVGGRNIAVTNRGLFAQEQNDPLWKRVESLDSTSGYNVIHSTRNGIIYTGTAARNIFRSDDGGYSWMEDREGFPSSNVTKFSDDVFGAIYAIITSQNLSTLYRRNPASSRWERIDTNLRNYTRTSLRIYDVGGDSTLEAATTYGIYTSTNEGQTWTSSFNGIMSEEIYGLQYLPDKIVVSTTLGVFAIDKNLSSNAWKKTYPVTGYLSSRYLRRDSYNNLYVLEQLPSGTNHQPNSLKSTDQGMTWEYDSLGIAKVPLSGSFFSSIYYIDPFAGQHYGLSSNSSQPIRIYEKKQQAEWLPDTLSTGFTSSGQNQFKIFTGFGSNKSNLYFSSVEITNQSYTASLLFRRAFSESKWSLDTTGLGDAGIISMASDRSGNMFAGSLSKGNLAGIYKNSGSAWEKLNVPAAGTSDARIIAVDSSNTLYVNFGPYFVGSNRGVYLTADEGKTWDYAGLDSIYVRGLTVKQDTTFAFTTRGAYKLSKMPRKNPVMVLDKKSVSFGKIEKWHTDSAYVKCSNIGEDTLRVTNIYSTNSAFYADTRVFNVAPKSFFNILVRFSPTANGPHEGTLRIVSNTFPDSIVCNGEGAGFKYPKMVFSLESIDFGQVKWKETKDTMVTIYNKGEDTLRISNIFTYNSSFSPQPKSLEILAGDSARLTVSFSPLVNGNILSYIRFNGNMPYDSIMVTGIGYDVPAPELVLSSKYIDFGEVETGTSRDTVIKISNPGGATLRINEFELNSQNFFMTIEPESIIPGGDTIAGIKFIPDREDNFLATVRITSNAGTDSVNLAGRGKAVSVYNDRLAGNPILDIYPNPTARDVSIKFEMPYASNVSVSLCDILGNSFGIIQETALNSGNYEFNTALAFNGYTLPKGYYFLKLETDKHTVIKPVIKSE